MIGQTVSHYRIFEKLGEGGMGVVYKAQDLKLGRIVALKFLPPELTRNPEAKKRFIHEAQAASALQHNNICTVHDIDETPEGQLFIVMDFYEGETLKGRIERGALSLEDAVDIARQSALGLEHAHAQGVIHRDIKPANVLITDSHVVKIVDFGLAKLSGQTFLTKAGSTLGTAAYMSPEQARGEELDARTDIWSLGVMLYQMLSGKTPFHGEHEAALLYSIVNENIQPLTASRPDLPEKLTAIVAKMLQKDRDLRYSTMKDVAQELSALRSGGSEPRRTFLSFEDVKRPRIAVPLVVILLTLASALYYWVQRNSKFDWSRNVALPEIIRLADAGEWVAAYDLAMKATDFIPSDPILLKYIDESTSLVSINSEPAEVKCSYKGYSDTTGHWVSLGVTPIIKRVPRGIFRVRYSKDGFTTLDVLRNWSNRASPRDTLRVKIVLDSLGAVPDGMVRIRAGEYWLYMPGMDNLKVVTKADYFIDKFEVTNREFKRFVDAGGYQNRSYWKEKFVKYGKEMAWDEAVVQFVDATGRPGPATWEVGTYPEGKADYPVGGLSWYEAAAFAEFAGKDLPSIFHWNKAANTWHAASVIANSNLSGTGPVPVGSKEGVSYYGVFDMAGNVREWCWNQERANRFILGGGWNDQPYSFTDAFTQDPFDRSPTNGFRCVKYLEHFSDTSMVLSPAVRAYRDYRKERPVPDALFKSYLRLYAYDKVPLREKIEAIDSTEDWVKQFVTFDAAYGNERMMAHVFLPRGVLPPYQTIVLFPGSEAIFQRSSKSLGSSYYSFFVKTGHAFIFPIYKGTFERGDGFNTDTPNESISYKEHVIQWTKDCSRVIDYIESRGDLDATRIAYYGLSWGGLMGGLIPAVEPRIRIVILNVGGLDLHKSQPEVDPLNFVTHIKVPVLMINGKYDHFFPVELSQKPMFDLLGTPSEHKKQYIYEASHSVPVNLVAKQSLEWLDRYFGPVKQK